MKRTLLALLSAFLLASFLIGCGAQAPVAETQAPESQTEAAKTEAQEPDKATSAVAGAEDMTAVEDVVEDGMVPVYADSLKDGVYPVAMKSSSSMFKADHVELVVENGRMQAVLYMTSKSYLYMYAGTAEEAAAADASAYIPLEEESEELGSFTLPVEALDEGVSCAAFSKNKELWYDRTLLFRSDSLPMEAFADGVLTTPESLGLADGAYTIEVALTGGSGKAGVASPARLTVADGVFTASIEWSSANYDYMKIGDEKYLPVNTEGNSVFEIPVTVLDSPMAVIADTTAMSQPYEIEYALLFSADSIEAAP